MKKYLFCVIVSLVGCSNMLVTTEDLTQAVKESITETFAVEYPNMVVQEVMLVHVDGKQYKGYANIFSKGIDFNDEEDMMNILLTNGQGRSIVDETHQITISVIYDGKSFMWEIQR